MTPQYQRLMTNIEEMIQECQSVGFTRVFTSGITYSYRLVELKILDDVHMKLVEFCKDAKAFYINNTNIRDSHLFKDGIDLLESGKVILCNNFTFCLNYFLYNYS